MSALTSGGRYVSVSVENIGGIDATTVELPPGVSVLVGRNATNRTSFLQAIMAVHGSNWTSVKGDAERGEVELTVGQSTYTQTVTRTGNGVVSSGEGLLSDATLADLFAFLLEDNEARRAVERGDDLRELLMRPIDVAEIQRQIRDAEQRKQELDDELDRIESLKQELPTLERRRAELRDEIDRHRADIDSIESEIDDRSLDIEITRENKDELEHALDELQATRSELRRVRDEIQSEQESITALRDERGRLAAERNSLPDAPDERRAEIDAEVERLRERKRERSEYTARIQNVIEFNEEMLAGEHDQIAEAIGGKPQNVGDITDQLYQGSKITCWTCGSQVQRDRVNETLDSMRAHRQEELSEIDEIEERLDELLEDRDSIEAAISEREDLTETITDIDDEIERRQATVADLRERRTNLSARVGDLEERVDELRSEEFDEVLELHTEASELERQLDQLESELDELNTEIEEKEAEIRRNTAVLNQRESVAEELLELRSRIDRLETEAVDEFNEAMSELLEILGYDNIERIWIERIKPTESGGSSLDSEENATFELHVVRTTEGGTVYEDTVDHLSESEREVTGLVFALAGYLVHDVHEEVPFMLLDSLEAIDAERIAALVEYFAEHVPYLLVALLPEDAQALPAEYNRVTEI